MSNLGVCPIYCILAAHAPIAAVFQRHSKRWWRVLQWNVDERTVTPGAWFSGQLSPRGSSVSTCGKFLMYLARKPALHTTPALTSRFAADERTGAQPRDQRAEVGQRFWSAGSNADDGYRAISKLPYLSALIAWRSVVVDGDSTRVHVTWVTSRKLEQLGVANKLAYTSRRCRNSHEVLHQIPEGALLRRFPTTDMARAPKYFGLRHYAGWKELPMSWSPIQPTLDADFQLLGRESPTGGTNLGFAWNSADREPGWIELRQRFFVGTSPDRITVLDGVNWAQWSPDGRLLTSTKYGDLQIRKVSAGDTAVIWQTNIRAVDPDPQPAPAWARHL